VNAALVSLAAAVTCALSPAAAGSGIPDVKVYLDGVVVKPSPFSRATLAAKALGSVGAVAGGLSVGKEGPFAHMGACVADALADAARLPARSRRRQDAVAFGAAAGVAAAFRAPLGGALFALEEAAGGAAPPRRLAPSLAATAATVVALRIAAGRSPLLRGAVFPLPRNGDGGADAAATGAPFLLEPRFVLPALLLGALGGAAGAAFTSATRRVCVWRQRRRARRARGTRRGDAPHRPHWRSDVAEAAAVSLLTSAACFAAARAFACRACPASAAASGACPSPAHAHASIYLPFACADASDATSSYYSPAASLFLPTPEAAVRALFATRSPSAFPPAALALFAVVSASLTVLTYGLQLPAGLFVPLIAAGAAAGRLAGTLATRLLGESATSASASASDEAVFALLGAAALLGGAMRCALSLCVILLELTDSLSLLPLLLLALLSARSLGDALGGGARSGLYDVHARAVKRAPMLPPAPPPGGGGGLARGRTTAGGIACAFQALREKEGAARVAAALRGGAAHGASCADADAVPPLVVADGGGDADAHGAHAWPVLLGALRPRAARAALRRALAASSSSAAAAAPVDLRAAASRSRPLLVREGATLAQLHALFGTLRVNCVAVVPESGTRVMGVVTRQALLRALDDVLEEEEDDVDGGAPRQEAEALVPARPAGDGSSSDEDEEEAA
jgi:H+/Cl- antiporter ClcA